MKKILLSVVALFVMVSAAFAEDAKVEMEYSLLSIDEKVVVGETLQKIDKSKRVYLKIIGGLFGNYTKTTELTKTLFTKQGITVVGNKKDADIEIYIQGIAFDFDEVETNIDSGIDKERLAAAIGSAVFTGGASLIGEMWHPSKGETKAVVFSTTYTVRAENTKSTGISSKIIFKSNKDGAEVANAVYLSFVANLVEKHFAKIDTEPAKVAEITQSK